MSPTPESASELAELAVQITRNVTGFELDYSQETLEHVDEMVLGFRDGGLTVREMEESMVVLGCYLGEVIVRNCGGTWKWSEETQYRTLAPPGTLVLEMPNEAVWNPIGKAFKLLENGAEDSLAFFCSVVCGQYES